MGVNRPMRGLPRRAYYPSGPWIDGIRPPACDPPTEKEKKFSPPGNPNPLDYRLVQAKEVGRFLVLKVKYPDCTNYEGEKILVFKGLNLIDLVNQKVIDPHFFESREGLVSPIARFVPTDEGWAMALAFTEMMERE